MSNRSHTSAAPLSLLDGIQDSRLESLIPRLIALCGGSHGSWEEGDGQPLHAAPVNHLRVAASQLGEHKPVGAMEEDIDERPAVILPPQLLILIHDEDLHAASRN